MRNNKRLLQIAAILNLFTAFVHLLGGQFDLVNPMLNSDLLSQAKTEWLACWHVITVVLFGTSYYLLKSAFGKRIQISHDLLKAIAYMYILFSLPFIGASFWMGEFAPQWILLLPIGLLTLLGAKRNSLNG